MKRGSFILLFALFLPLLLSACHESPPPETQIQVNILETEGFTVENNGQYIQPGEDAVFLLHMDSGYSIADTDYTGIYRAVTKGRSIELTLEEVQYPSHISLNLTSRFCSITYLPNGGEGDEATVTYDTSVHLRPNTSIGTNMFVREGYTLTAWNTRPDGTGNQVGLGSRVSVPLKGLTLYAQWAEWSSPSEFAYTLEDDTVTINAYRGNDTCVVVPAFIDGFEVTAIGTGAFRGVAMTELILPPTLDVIEESAFWDCGLESITLFDNIEEIRDNCFTGCNNLKTLRINAIEAPYGYNYRKESCYADKVDLLIQAQGKPKLVFYGGCSVWYNLDPSQLSPLLEGGYSVINMGLNGTVNSTSQMQIMGSFLERGDILFHTPEIASSQQLLIAQEMSGEYDDRLWCGLECNYDLFALVDLRTVPGAFDSFCDYLSLKGARTTYNQVYMEDEYKTFCDRFGCIPFYRMGTEKKLGDAVYLDPKYINAEAMDRLKAFYDQYQDKGVRVYLSYACVNMDTVPEEQRGNVALMDRLFREAIEGMEGPVLISSLEDFLYQRDDFYDTNYHLLSVAAARNTEIWLRDLLAQMEKDGLWVPEQ